MLARLTHLADYNRGIENTSCLTGGMRHNTEEPLAPPPPRQEQKTTSNLGTIDLTKGSGNGNGNDEEHYAPDNSPLMNQFVHAVSLLASRDFNHQNAEFMDLKKQGLRENAKLKVLYGKIDADINQRQEQSTKIQDLSGRGGFGAQQAREPTRLTNRTR